MTIREVIIESGRWDCILEIIGEILKTPDNEYPVNMRYEEDGTVTNYVSMKNVRHGIANWLMFVDMENLIASDEQRLLLDSFSRYVEALLDVDLYRYAVDLSHRLNVRESRLENIRALSILNSSIDYILLGLDLSEENSIPFEVPSGWKKQ